MKKQDELGLTSSCWNRAQPDEMIFVLLGRDAAAPHAIRAWVRERVRLGKNVPSDLQIVTALQCAESMGSVHPAIDLDGPGVIIDQERARRVKAEQERDDARRELSKCGEVIAQQALRLSEGRREVKDQRSRADTLDRLRDQDRARSDAFACRVLEALGLSGAASTEDAVAEAGRLRKALEIYADPANWCCPRCKKRDALNCSMTLWTGPCGLSANDDENIGADNGGYTEARTALAHSPAPMPDVTKKDARLLPCPFCGSKCVLNWLSEPPEFCICSAIRMPDGEVIYGHRHNHCLDVVRARPGVDREDIYKAEQGFVTSRGRFVDRREAMQIQKASGRMSQYSKDGLYNGDGLFSEDLYRTPGAPSPVENAGQPKREVLIYVEAPDGVDPQAIREQVTAALFAYPDNYLAPIQVLRGKPPDIEITRRIERLRSLQPDWDSYGAPAIDPRAIAVAEAILSTCGHATPTSSGGVQIEWHCGGVDLEFGITPEGTIVDESEPTGTDDDLIPDATVDAMREHVERRDIRFDKCPACGHDWRYHIQGGCVCRIGSRTVWNGEETILCACKVPRPEVLRKEGDANCPSTNAPAESLADSARCTDNAAPDAQQSAPGAHITVRALERFATATLYNNGELPEPVCLALADIPELCLAFAREKDAHDKTEADLKSRRRICKQAEADRDKYWNFQVQAERQLATLQSHHQRTEAERDEAREKFAALKADLIGTLFGYAKQPAQYPTLAALFARITAQDLK